MHQRLIIDRGKCTGCLVCVDVCAGVKAGLFGDQYSRVRIQTDEALGVSTPLVCTQCEEHFCAEVCPVEAIRFHSGLNIYVVDDQECTGCGECVESCPYSGIFMGIASAMKCDLCQGQPACADACVPMALRWGSVDPEAAEETQSQETGGGGVRAGE
ncbi:MAG: 4Fe-4S dicluster domain-containing protein [Proteobacteria bacterium]|nr:4Fe-4S dicluster domain-containing protein [Pseudomonadota bacterium]